MSLLDITKTFQRVKTRSRRNYKIFAMELKQIGNN